ncbi:MAG: DUF2851 family protein [bacterium]
MEPSRDLFLPLLNQSTTNLSEDELLLLWKYICPRLNTLSTVTDQSVTVTDPGRIKPSEGPDVNDVTIELGGITRTGSVEIHRQTADWYHHEHHRDRAFNKVILHVVLTGERTKVRREDDNWSSTVVLGDHLSEIESLLATLDDELVETRRKAVKRPCYRENPSGVDVRKKLDRAGRVWLDKRAAEIRKLGNFSLLQASVQALGYSRNHDVFRCLVQRLDLDRFTTILSKGQPVGELEGYLIGLGGWFQRTGSFNSAIYNRRCHWRNEWKSDNSLISDTRWNRAGVRPHARPIRRWVDFCWGLHRLYRKGDALNDWVQKAPRTHLNGSNFRSRVHEELEEILGYPSGTYWNYHYSLSDPHRGSVPSSLGSNWFDQYIVNVMLPHLYYESFTRGDSRGRQTVVDQFMSYPPTLGNRRTRRIKKQWGFDPEATVYRSAAQQQGAVQFYKHGCVPGRCDQCDLKRDGYDSERSLFSVPR